MLVHAKANAVGAPASYRKGVMPVHPKVDEVGAPASGCK